MQVRLPDAGGAHVLHRNVSRGMWIGLILAAATIIFIGNVTDIDRLLADAAFDRNVGDFPLRHAWVTEVFSHVILKGILVVLGLSFIGVALWDIARPQAWSWRRRFQLRVVAWSATLVPATVALLKKASSSHCPWDIDRYGGSAPYTRLLQALPEGVSYGQCMPAGHASSAMWLIALAVFFLPGRPRTAALAGSLLLMLGIAVGWLQQLRGAHFLTHTLWTAWIAVVIVWRVMAALDAQPCRRTRRHAV